MREEVQYHCDNCRDYMSTVKKNTMEHEVKCISVREEFEPVVEEFIELLEKEGVTDPIISWEGSYSSSNHGMDYHPYRYLQLKFSRGEREYDFEFSSDSGGYGHYTHSIGTAQQMLNDVLSRVGTAIQEVLQGVLERNHDYEWEVGYASLEDFLNENVGKIIRIQVISDN